MKKVRIIVRGAARPARFCPVSARVDRSVRELEHAVLVDAARNAAAPFQAVPAAGGATVHWVVDSLGPRQQRSYLLQSGSRETGGGQVQVKGPRSGGIAVKVGGELLTRYVYGGGAPKPCLYPLVGPFGEGVTRAFPQEEVEGDSTDHMHHRSLWTAWGDVNGSDNWAEGEGAGRMAHCYFDAAEGGPVFGRIAAMSDWVDASGDRLMQDRVEYRFYNVPPSFRLFDVSVTFYASEGDVRFGDTKEGGTLSLRVAASMEGGRTGTVTNAPGAVTEAETWGRRAAWCDYSGRVGEHTVGIAVFDHPSNLRYPTCWHVRDYGLMAANPFGPPSFPDCRGGGPYVLNAGDNLTFRYRVLIHAGGVEEGGVRDKYLEWLFPPSVTAEE